MFPSGASDFYKHMFNSQGSASLRTLVGRASYFARQNNINVIDFMLNNSYRSSMLNSIKGYVVPGTDGFIDSVRLLLSNYYVDHARDTLQLLVNSF